MSRARQARAGWSIDRRRGLDLARYVPKLEALQTREAPGRHVVRRGHLESFGIEFPARDPVTIEDRLVQIGAHREWTRRQRDTFFVVPNGVLKLDEIEGEPPVLISSASDSSHPGPRRIEQDQLELGDLETWRRALGRVLEVDRVVRKIRSRWRQGRTRIDLDRTQVGSDLISVEIPITGSDPAVARREIELVLEGLGLSAG